MRNLEHELAAKSRNRKRFLGVFLRGDWNRNYPVDKKPCQNNKGERKHRTCNGTEGDLVVEGFHGGGDG